MSISPELAAVITNRPLAEAEHLHPIALFLSLSFLLKIMTVSAGEGWVLPFKQDLL